MLWAFKCSAIGAESWCLQSLSVQYITVLNAAQGSCSCSWRSGCPLSEWRGAALVGVLAFVVVLVAYCRSAVRSLTLISLHLLL